jgi:hypothetical protein
MTDTINIAADYTMINPQVEAVQYDGTEAHASEYLQSWMETILDRESVPVQFRTVEPGKQDSDLVVWFMLDLDDESKDIKVSPGDWLVAKRGTEDDLFRVRVWKDDNFQRTFKPMGV